MPTKGKGKATKKVRVEDPESGPRGRVVERPPTGTTGPSASAVGDRRARLNIHVHNTLTSTDDNNDCFFEAVMRSVYYQLDPYHAWARRKVSRADISNMRRYVADYIAGNPALTEMVAAGVRAEGDIDESAYETVRMGVQRELASMARSGGQIGLITVLATALALNVRLVVLNDRSNGSAMEYTPFHGLPGRYMRYALPDHDDVMERLDNAVPVYLHYHYAYDANDPALRDAPELPGHYQPIEIPGIRDVDPTDRIVVAYTLTDPNPDVHHSVRIVATTGRRRHSEVEPEPEEDPFRLEELLLPDIQAEPLPHTPNPEATSSTAIHAPVEVPTNTSPATNPDEPSAHTPVPAQGPTPSKRSRRSELERLAEGHKWQRQTDIGVRKIENEAERRANELYQQKHMPPERDNELGFGTNFGEQDIPWQLYRSRREGRYRDRVEGEDEASFRQFGRREPIPDDDWQQMYRERTGREWRDTPKPTKRKTDATGEPSKASRPLDTDDETDGPEAPFPTPGPAPTPEPTGTDTRALVVHSPSTPSPPPPPSSASPPPMAAAPETRLVQFDALPRGRPPEAPIRNVYPTLPRLAPPFPKPTAKARPFSLGDAQKWAGDSANEYLRGLVGRIFGSVTIPHIQQFVPAWNRLLRTLQQRGLDMTNRNVRALERMIRRSYPGVQFIQAMERFQRDVGRRQERLDPERWDEVLRLVEEETEFGRRAYQAADQAGAATRQMLVDAGIIAADYYQEHRNRLAADLYDEVSDAGTHLGNVLQGAAATVGAVAGTAVGYGALGVNAALDGARRAFGTVTGGSEAAATEPPVSGGTPVQPAPAPTRERERVPTTDELLEGFERVLDNALERVRPRTEEEQPPPPATPAAGERLYPEPPPAEEPIPASDAVRDPDAVLAESVRLQDQLRRRNDAWLRRLEEMAGDRVNPAPEQRNPDPATLDGPVADTEPPFRSAAARFRKPKVPRNVRHLLRENRVNPPASPRIAKPPARTALGPRAVVPAQLWQGPTKPAFEDYPGVTRAELQRFIPGSYHWGTDTSEEMHRFQIDARENLGDRGVRPVVRGSGRRGRPRKDTLLTDGVGLLVHRPRVRDRNRHQPRDEDVVLYTERNAPTRNAKVNRVRALTYADFREVLRSLNPDDDPEQHLRYWILPGVRFNERWYETFPAEEGHPNGRVTRQQAELLARRFLGAQWRIAARRMVAAEAENIRNSRTVSHPLLPPIPPAVDAPVDEDAGPARTPSEGQEAREATPDDPEGVIDDDSRSSARTNVWSIPGSTTTDEERMGERSVPPPAGAPRFGAQPPQQPNPVLRSTDPRGQALLRGMDAPVVRQGPHVPPPVGTPTMILEHRPTPPSTTALVPSPNPVRPDSLRAEGVRGFAAQAGLAPESDSGSSTTMDPVTTTEPKPVGEGPVGEMPPDQLNPRKPLHEMQRSIFEAHRIFGNFDRGAKARTPVAQPNRFEEEEEGDEDTAHGSVASTQRRTLSVMNAFGFEAWDLVNTTTPGEYQRILRGSMAERGMRYARDLGADYH